MSAADGPVDAPKVAESPRYPIGSVDNALRLLLLLERETSVSVTEVAQHLGVALSTAHRMISMLRHYGFIEQDPSLKTYRFGPTVVRMGLTSLQSFDIRAISRPHLERLVTEINETAHLVALRGRDVVFLECVECMQALRATSRTGRLLPAHCTAGGKALLAMHDDSYLRKLYPFPKLEGLTKSSLVDLNDLLSEIDRIRGQGYALSNRESETDLNAVAVTVVDRTGQPRCALTVSGPPDRLGAKRLRTIAKLLREAAADMAQQLI